MSVDRFALFGGCFTQIPGPPPQSHYSCQIPGPFGLGSWTGSRDHDTKTTVSFKIPLNSKCHLSIYVAFVYILFFSPKNTLFFSWPAGCKRYPPPKKNTTLSFNEVCVLQALLTIFHPNQAVFCAAGPTRRREGAFSLQPFSNNIQP